MLEDGWSPGLAGAGPDPVGGCFGFAFRETLGRVSTAPPSPQTFQLSPQSAAGSDPAGEPPRPPRSAGSVPHGNAGAGPASRASPSSGAVDPRQVPTELVPGVVGRPVPSPRQDCRPGGSDR